MPPRQRSEPSDGLGPRAVAPHRRPMREPTEKVTAMGIKSHRTAATAAAQDGSAAGRATDVPLRRTSKPTHYAGMNTYDLDVKEARVYHALGVEDEGYAPNLSNSHARRVAEAMTAIDPSMAGNQAYHDDVCSSCMAKSEAFRGACGSTSVQIGATSAGHVVGQTVIGTPGESLAQPSVGQVAFRRGSIVHSRHREHHS